ncbi:phospholipase D-like domain-containing protein [Clostridium sp. SHJSY1]|uniref:phospholipase D-like domain-containing protein n=1 Tax=Clostridium sp. SHJSY1 TaxID=2942483 RepID=UPI00287468CB|nr:phospholipase D-like domain-containing protein [Clostridium sp. SHJSY1]MDS0525878.1 phospholipase D-like domain-containing protein [Clostridium sp. SHJSY1]
MGKDFIDFICCKLGRKKILKETKMNYNNLNDDILDSIVTTEKDIEEEMVYQVKQLKKEFQYIESSTIRKYIYDIIYKLMKENEKITEEQVVNALSWFVNNAYKDMLRENKDWIIKNNKEFITSISNMIKDSIHINKNENDEISKAMNKSMSIYYKSIKELMYNQVKELKMEIDKSIGGQLVLTNKEFEANNINIVVLEKKLKKYTNEIMNDFVIQNKKQVNMFFDNISSGFEKLKQDVNNGEINKEPEKTLDDFKEIYDNSLQKSIDGTLEIARELNKFNIVNYQIVKNNEVRMKFEEAFNLAENEIDIIGPDINNHVLYKTGIHNFIENVIRKGISVKILYGIDEKEKNNSERASLIRKNLEKIEQRLKRDFQGYGYNFKIKKGETHSKILICDNKFAMIGSYNFLLFDGDKNETIDEIAAITTDPITIKKLRMEEFNF